MSAIMQPATIKEIALAMAITERSAQDRAAKGGWKYEEEVLKTGAKRRLYNASSLPRDIFAALLVYRVGGTAIAGNAAADPEYRPTPAEIYQRAAQDQPDPAKRRIDARLEILAAHDKFQANRGATKFDAARDRFLAAYNAGALELPAWVRETKPKLCRNSLINWTKRREAGKLRDLAGHYGGRKGTGIFDQHQGLIDQIVGDMTDHPKKSIKNLWNAAKATLGETLELVDAETGEVTSRPFPSIRAVERFVADWKERNKALWARATDPDGYRNKYEYAAGSMYKHIARRNELWEIDASPADVMCLDGRHSIYVLIDMFSRWPRARVTKTPRTAAALLLIRDCIIGWPDKPETAFGVPETLRTDNGSDFVSAHFTDTVRRIGIHQDVCAPYSPQQKAGVERMIGTIQQQFMEQQPGFIGHNVTDRRLIEARHAFAQRLGQDDNDAFCVELSAAELQERLDDWIEKVYVHQPHDGLNGKTPFAVRAAYRGRIARIEGEGSLEMLLAAPPDGRGTRIVGKKGVQVDKIDYYHVDLMPGETVQVRLDPDDTGRIYVYRNEPWEFVGLAINPERAGVPRTEVAGRVRASQKAVLDAGMKEIRRQQRGINTAGISLDIAREAERANSNLLAFPAPTEPYSTPDLVAASAAAAAGRGKRAPAAVTPAEERMRAEIEADLAGPSVVAIDTEQTRFGRARRIERAQSAGGDVDPEDAQWLQVYRTLPEYKFRKMMIEDFGEDFALEA